MKMQHSKYAASVDREKQEAAQTSEKSIAQTRRDLVRRRVLKKCMQSKREEVERQQASKMFGRYDGESVEHIASQIDTHLEENHPRHRRRRKVDWLCQTAYDKGDIMKGETMKDKVRNFFDRPLLHVQTVDEKESSDEGDEIASMHTFPPLSKTKSFYTDKDFSVSSCERYELGGIPERDEWHEDSEDNGSNEKVFVRRVIPKFPTDEVRENMSVQSDAPKMTVYSPCKRDIRPLTLPPLKPERDNAVLNTSEETSKPDCISELIERLHTANEKRERESRVRSERRAKRLQADRVRRLDGNNIRTGQSRSSWDVYERKRSELMSSIESTKKVIGLTSEDGTKTDAMEKKGRLCLPPIKVTQKVVLTK